MMSLDAWLHRFQKGDHVAVQLLDTPVPSIATKEGVAAFAYAIPPGSYAIVQECDERGVFVIVATAWPMLFPHTWPYLITKIPAIGEEARG